MNQQLLLNLRNIENCLATHLFNLNLFIIYIDIFVITSMESKTYVFVKKDEDKIILSNVLI